MIRPSLVLMTGLPLGFGPHKPRLHALLSQDDWTLHRRVQSGRDEQGPIASSFTSRAPRCLG
jgi:hypothetical protein